MESILNSIKKLLGITEDYDAFDTDIILHINSVFSILSQLGVGPEKAYRITDASNEWDEFTGDSECLELVKSYMYMRVRLMFDPPTNSFLVSSMQEQIKEAEWRLNVIAEGERLAKGE